MVGCYMNLNTHTHTRTYLLETTFIFCLRERKKNYNNDAKKDKQVWECKRNVIKFIFLITGGSMIKHPYIVKQF